ncbi:MAG: IS1595 family transposase [Crocinitomix sp.]|nr:IS1595 family transposase [Crocinitomix sp.]
MAKKDFTIFDLMARFPDEKSCIIYLSEQKWASGYCCIKCGSTKNKQGKKKDNKRCKTCGYEESPTSNTLFHKIKFPLQKAFYICYQLSVNKKGMSTLELSRQYGLSQKTCWFFKRKVQKAMVSSDAHPLEDVLEIDEFSIGSHEKEKPGRSDGKKKKVILGVEIVLNKKEKLTIGRAYSRVIDDYSTQSFKPFFEEKINAKSTIFTDLWSSYKPLSNKYDINQEKSNNGESMKLLHTHIMNMKGWLRGIHHHISTKHAQCYMDEYHFKFNRRLNLENCFDKLILGMTKNEWFSYKMASQTT